ncbi:MAG: ABC transporter permease [Nitrospira sp.]|nr:ABC transporter permease [Nitrospira sp.]
MERQATISVEDNVVYCRGAWTLPNLSHLEQGGRTIRWPDTSTVLYDAGEVTAMDTGGALMLQRYIDGVPHKGQQTSLQGLKPEFEQLLQKLKGQSIQAGRDAVARGNVRWAERLLRAIQSRQSSAVRALAFIGESTLALCRSIARPQSIRWKSLMRFVELDGVRALPITGLLTFLVGVVIAYQGAEQLRKFGTNIFIVDLVGISLLREIAPLIVAILIAGRSGSAYTAEIGTMKVTEELDAVRTLGISPMNLLVLPRALGLIIALPLLTVYADAVGVFGGMLIALGELNVSFVEFVSRFEEAVPVRHLLIGLGKAPFFAALIALVGCYQGFQIRGGVDDVGRRTTISVVQGIFLVIVFDAICSILLNWWDL